MYETTHNKEISYYDKQKDSMRGVENGNMPYGYGPGGEVRKGAGRKRTREKRNTKRQFRPRANLLCFALLFSRVLFYFYLLLY